jgi:hypothetical protein
MKNLGISLLSVAALLLANSYATAAVTVTGNAVTGDSANDTIVALAFGNRALVFADGQSFGVVDVSSGLTVDGGGGTDLFLLLGNIQGLNVTNVERDLSNLFGNGGGGGGIGGGNGGGNGGEDDGEETEDGGSDEGSETEDGDTGNGGGLGGGGLGGGLGGGGGAVRLHR